MMTVRLTRPRALAAEGPVPWGGFGTCRRHVIPLPRLVRMCWCENCPLTCPVHVLGAFFKCACVLHRFGVGQRSPLCRTCPWGCRPFGGVSSAGAVADLRRALAHVGVLQAETFGTHALRRGHAQDLLEKGAGLNEILRAGEWRWVQWLVSVRCLVLGSGRQVRGFHALCGP